MIEALLDRLNSRRLPRLLAIIDNLEKGEVLPDYELEYLEKVIREAGDAMRIVDRNPEYQELWSQIFSLYKEIADLALGIEETADTRGDSVKA